MSLTFFTNAFEGYNIRVSGTEDNPLFVAKDVCTALGITKYRDALARLEAKYKKLVIVETVGGKQSMAKITEAGLYSLINRSNKPIAKAFKKWVNTEVLPSIRKTGSYSISKEHRDDLRLSSVQVRKETMAALQAAGFTESHHYINVTQMVYRGLFGMDTAQLRKARGLSEKANVREHFTKQELGMVRMIELMLQEVLISKVFTSSADLNQYVKTVSQGVKGIKSVDPTQFISAAK